MVWSNLRLRQASPPTCFCYKTRFQTWREFATRPYHSRTRHIWGCPSGKTSHFLCATIQLTIYRRIYLVLLPVSTQIFTSRMAMSWIFPEVSNLHPFSLDYYSRNDLCFLYAARLSWNRARNVRFLPGLDRIKPLMSCLRSSENPFNYDYNDLGKGLIPLRICQG